MKKLFLSLTLLLAPCTQVKAFDFNQAAATVTSNAKAGADKVVDFGKGAWQKMPSTDCMKKSAASVYAAGKAQATKLWNVSPRETFVALVERAKNNPLEAIGAVAVATAGIWALNKTYRFFMPKRSRA